MGRRKIWMVSPHPDIVIVPDHNMQRDAAFSLVHRHVTLRVRRVSRGRRDVRTGNQSHP